MRKFPTALAVILYAAAIAAQDNSTSNAPHNYRPSNVSANLTDLYFWVGSYYNATAQLDFTPYGGLASSLKSPCPAAFSNQTASKNYTARLGITEPSPYNSVGDPANVFLTLWPLDFNFTSLRSGQMITEMPGLEFALFSSTPLYGSDDPANNWIWSLEKTTSPPYNLSSTITMYGGWQFLTIDTATPCDYSSNWLLGIDSISLNGTNLTTPAIDLQFDGSTANLTLQGYTAANDLSGDGPRASEGDTRIFGEFRLTLSSVIDPYHSDVLRNDTSTPTWLPTVGYNNNSANFGYTTQSTGSRIVAPLSLTAVVFALWLIIS